MISESEALARIFALIVPAPAESAPLLEAVGRFAADDIWATVPLPGFDHSGMDGYALAEKDCGQTDRWLEVTGEQAAGAPVAGSIGSGRVMRIFTGAPVPAGTAAVVMQEDTEIRDGGASIRVTDAARPGDFIRLCGADLCAGQKILSAGDEITPARIGLIASQGLTKVSVGRRPRIALLSTGDELTQPGRPLPHPAAIYNSNGPMIEALLRQDGIGSVTSVHAANDLEGLTEKLGTALASHDVIILSGGVSVGARDFTKPALAALGFTPDIWRVAMKPGKPFLFATKDEKLVFGLPGNPVSAFVTFVVLARPALRRWQGANEASALPRRTFARVGDPLSNPGDRPHYIRGAVDAQIVSRPTGLQESHALFALSQSNALLRLDPAASLAAGEWAAIIEI